MIVGATSVKTNRDAVVPTVAELAIIADKIEAKFRAFVLISAWCGLRFGEVTELHSTDFSEGCEVINLTRGVTHLTEKQAAASGKPRFNISAPNPGKTRKVIVPPHIRADVQPHLETHAESDGLHRLFPPVRGGCHISDRVVRDAFRGACKSAGVTNMRIHDMRHFAGHQTARVANPPETIKRLGHSTSTASLRYQGEVSGRAVEIADALSALATVPELADLAASSEESAADA